MAAQLKDNRRKRAGEFFKQRFEIHEGAGRPSAENIHRKAMAADLSTWYSMGEEGGGLCL